LLEALQQRRPEGAGQVMAAFAPVQAMAAQRPARRGRQRVDAELRDEGAAGERELGKLFGVPAA
jgi:hypothetical protein